MTTFWTGSGAGDASRSAAREMTNAAYVYAKLGDTASANRFIREMERTTPRPWFVDVSKASVLLATATRRER